MYLLIPYPCLARYQENKDESDTDPASRMCSVIGERVGAFLEEKCSWSGWNNIWMGKEAWHGVCLRNYKHLRERRTELGIIGGNWKVGRARLGSPDTDLRFCPVSVWQGARVKILHIILEPSRRGKNLLLFYTYLELLGSCCNCGIWWGCELWQLQWVEENRMWLRNVCVMQWKGLDDPLEIGERIIRVTKGLLLLPWLNGADTYSKGNTAPPGDVQCKPVQNHTVHSNCESQAAVWSPNFLAVKA